MILRSCLDFSFCSENGAFKINFLGEKNKSQQLQKQKTMEVFFYGLFMDKDILIKNEVNPSNPRMGYINNYTLKIGNRASLIQCENKKAYGIIMEVKDEEIMKLYNEKSVSDYIPEKVKVVTESNENIRATCYNLPLKLLKGTNELYAKSLYVLAKKLNLPEDYLREINKYISPQNL